MTRSEIELPDETFARAKKLCEAREISLAMLSFDANILLYALNLTHTSLPR
jgi:hypothetical protein